MAWLTKYLKEKTKTDLDHALRTCINKREELQEALDDHSETFSIEGIKSDLEDLNEKWECVVIADWSFANNRVYCVESDAQELEIFDTKYEEERRKVLTITGQLEEKTRLQQVKYNSPVVVNSPGLLKRKREVQEEISPVTRKKIKWCEKDSTGADIESHFSEEERRKVLTITAVSRSAPPSCSSSQSPSLPNGSAITKVPGLPQPTDESSAPMLNILKSLLNILAVLFKIVPT